MDAKVCDSAANGTSGYINLIPIPLPAENSNIEIRLIDSIYDILDRRFKQLVKVVLDSVEANEENPKIKQKIWDIKDLLANDLLSLSVKRIRHRLNEEE